MSSREQHSTTMVFNGAGLPLSSVRVPIRSLGDGEVLVRITACTVCGSDLHTFTGRRSTALPMVLGHEIIGTVVSTCDSGKHNSELSVGDRVTWSIAASCNACGRCSDGLPQKCNSLFKYGHEAFDDHPLSGGLGEHCILQRGTRIVRLPDDLPDEVACPANCATATVAAAMRRAGGVKGRRVLVTGTGMLGLTTCAFANTAGAAEVVACDIDNARLRRAADFGATRLVQTVDSDTFDFVFEMSGSSIAVAAAFEATAIGGVVVLVGSVSPSDPVPIDPERIVRRLATIHGVHNYKPDDLVTAVEFLRSNHQRFPFANLVEATFGLEQAQAAMEYAETEKPIRVLVRPK